jgi:membrane-bound lytic murein transglycosylase B
MKQYANVISRIGQTYGGPAPRSSRFGGWRRISARNSPTLRALATLAYDCRRSAMFQAELMDVLRLIQRGDLSPNARGAWAAEVGQTQFMPSSYLKFADDFTGDGRRDLIHSVPDVLASTANFLQSYGWQRGGGWSQGSANFAVIKEWNKADVYSRTIAYFASKLSGGE